jgi:hypothetical protein
MKARAFLVAVFVSLAILFASFAVSSVHAYDVLDQRAATVAELKQQTGRLTAQVEALRQQLQTADLVPVVVAPATTGTTVPAPQTAAPRTTTTHATPPTTTTTLPTPGRGTPPTTCILLVCTKGH